MREGEYQNTREMGECIAIESCALCRLQQEATGSRGAILLESLLLSTCKMRRVLDEEVVRRGDLLPQVWGEEAVGLRDGLEHGLDEVTCDVSGMSVNAQQHKKEAACK